MKTIISTSIIVLVILAGVVLAVVKLVKDKKKGKSCGCGCSGCSASGICHRNLEKTDS